MNKFNLIFTQNNNLIAILIFHFKQELFYISNYFMRLLTALSMYSINFLLISLSF